MEHLYERLTPLDTAACVAFKASLSNVQGNILRAHGRDRALHVLLTFKKAQRPQVKAWIKELAQYVSSAQDAQGQPRQAEPRCLFVSFLLSASGYDYLDPHFAQRKAAFASEAFLCGMRSARWRLNDPPLQTWEAAYQRDIHAMLLLADNCEEYLQHKKDELCKGIEACADAYSVEYGKAMWMPDETKERGYRVEHFGYRDGISQPLFFQDDIDRVMSKGDGSNHYPPGAAPALVLVHDPYGRPGDCGSYLVFRKLEQRVRDFTRQELKLDQALASGAVQAEALIMGRFRNGIPVVRTSNSAPNNFNYVDDPDGQTCPVQAHIRAVNPRRRGIPYIVRRGITYGDREKEPKHNPRCEELPVDGVGLLFMCYQSNIEKQFEILQGLLANDPRRPRLPEGGIDPVIGQPGSLGTGQQLWPREQHAPRAEHIQYSFFNHVRLKGGEYFFAPSRHFLQNIDTILPEP